MRPYFLPFLISSLACIWGGEPVPSPLADAMWKGQLLVTAKGQLRNHYLANRMDNHGPTGFLQEKSKMNIDFKLKVNFFVNNVGEVSLAASQSFEADQSTISEEHFKFLEDTVLDGGIKTTLEVLQKVNKTTAVTFSDPEHELQLPNGFLQILPSGRIDKKGSIAIVGNLVFDYQGKGSYTLVKERNPPSEEFAVLQEKANVTKVYQLPLRFSMKIDFKKKPVEMVTPVIFETRNPFEDPDRSGKDTFTQNLQPTCKVKLTPLFGKAAK